MAMDMNQNLGNLMKEAQKMQQRMQEAQEQLTQLVVEGKSGGKMVIVKMHGNHYVPVRGVKINKALLEEDIEMLEDLVAAAINDAVRQVEGSSREKISQLTAGLNIPTDFLKEEGKE